jgi:hypothetical protein
LPQFQQLRNLSNDVFLSSNFIERQLSKHGGPKTKLVSLRNALQLVVVLPGKMAKETRAQFAGVIERYIAGDRSLHAEIEANAGSSNGIARLARESLGILENTGEDPVAIRMKRRREELELLKLAEEIKGMTQNRLVKLEENLKRIGDQNQSDGLEERARLMLKDSYMNLLLNEQHPGITNNSLLQHQGLLSSPNKPISIAGVAAELGYRPSSADSKRIGMDLKKRYVARHNKPPTKHKQLCDGRVTAVNSYMEADRDLVEAALHAYFRLPESEEC